MRILRSWTVQALVEVGNIMISTFINALSGLAEITTHLTVPAFAVDMQGAILAVPMAEFGGQSDYIMTIGADFLCSGRKVPCRLLLSPDIRSLNFLLKKLGVLDGKKLVVGTADMKIAREEGMLSPMLWGLVWGLPV